MSLLMRNARVETRDSGGFVAGIDGVGATQGGGAPSDWFYYVNGVQAPRGAASTTVHPGDHVWWDVHDWSQTQEVPAVVGSFPEPFLNGLEGKRLPVRIECEGEGTRACRGVEAQLRVLGVPVAISAPDSSAAGETLRVLVGRWASMRGDLAASGLGAGPRASGVYARFGAGGSSLSLLSADGAVTRTLGAGSGLVAATRHEQEAPVWFVTGTDEAGVDLAARAFDSASLDGHFAVAVSGSETLPLPQAAG